MHLQVRWPMKGEAAEEEAEEAEAEGGGEGGKKTPSA